jgi:hypothetical protein
MWFGRRRREQELADAREETLRWYERLGGQIMNLPSKDEPAVKQALVDAGERFTAAGAQLERATSVKQYALATQTALEGLSYIRAARVAMGLDPGPDIPPLATQRAAGSVNAVREVEVEGRQYKASPRPAGDTPYYYPGGMVQGRPVPQGWYSEPWWKTALAVGAGTVGSILVFDALFGGGMGWSGYGYGGYGGYDSGYDSGFSDGVQYADDHDNDNSGTDSGGDGDYQTAGYDGGNDYGSYDGGDYDGAAGSYDGGGFDGGFDGGGFDGGGGFF